MGPPSPRIDTIQPFPSQPFTDEQLILALSSNTLSLNAFFCTLPDLKTRKQFWTTPTDATYYVDISRYMYVDASISLQCMYNPESVESAMSCQPVSASYGYFVAWEILS